MLQYLLEIGTFSRDFRTFRFVTKGACGIITSKLLLVRCECSARVSVLPHSALRMLYCAKPKQVRCC